MASQTTEKAINLTTELTTAIENICELLNGNELMYANPEIVRSMLLSIYVDIDILKGSMKEPVEIYSKSLH